MLASLRPSLLTFGAGTPFAISVSFVCLLGFIYVVRMASVHPFFMFPVAHRRSRPSWSSPMRHFPAFAVSSPSAPICLQFKCLPIHLSARFSPPPSRSSAAIPYNAESKRTGLARPDSNGMRKIDLSAFQTATNFTARDINRRIVLDMIRTQQSISRAEIARRSGLQRSTISQIVEQLIVENWVLEGEIGRNLRGRRPRMLQLNLSRAGILGVSVRPLETTIAHADLNGRFHAQESFPTERDPEKFERELIAR